MSIQREKNSPRLQHVVNERNGKRVNGIGGRAREKPPNHDWDEGEREQIHTLSMEITC